MRCCGGADSTSPSRATNNIVVAIASGDLRHHRQNGTLSS
jgi:hypothetical protein